MKKFDLELANQGYPVCTREGRPARIICLDAKNNGFPLICLVEDSSGYEDVITCTIEGKYLDDGTDSDYDLFLVSTTHEGWINIYHGDGSPRPGNVVYCSEQDALADEYPTKVATIKIEWEE